jgi:hypothetical protein
MIDDGNEAREGMEGVGTDWIGSIAWVLMMGNL